MSDSKTKKLVMFITDGIFITHDRLVHIIKHRALLAGTVVAALPFVLNSPGKIGDNSKKRSNSYVYCRKIGRIAIRVVVEETKTPGISRVVSAFPMSLKDYEKLIDISGRADIPPYESSH